MPNEIERVDPYDPRPSAYQLGNQLGELLARLAEPTEQVERQIARRRTHYSDQGDVSLVEEEQINERITRRS